MDLDYKERVSSLNGEMAFVFQQAQPPALDGHAPTGLVDVRPRGFGGCADCHASRLY